MCALRRAVTPQLREDADPGLSALEVGGAVDTAGQAAGGRGIRAGGLAVVGVIWYPAVAWLGG